mmetsp:Transcript_56326/g.134417  ORF Transcript_56326/g.134417 Transcript_56326/m.134417 type:complete len:275 (-) Transcript_56326:1102-1926(-)
MGTVCSEPENGWHVCGTSSSNCQLHPVLDRAVFRLAHAENVALCHIMGHQHLFLSTKHHLHLAILWDHEGLVVGAILLSLRGHEPHVGSSTYLGRIQLAIGLAILDDNIIDARIATIRDDKLCIAQSVVLSPHLSSISHCRSHGCIHDHVRRHMKIRDASPGIHIGQRRPLLVASRQVCFDLCLLGMSSDLCVRVAHTVVGIHAELLKQRPVLVKGIFVVDLDAMAKEHRVGHLHHGGLEMQRIEDAWLHRIHFFLVKFAQLGHPHDTAVDDFT